MSEQPDVLVPAPPYLSVVVPAYNEELNLEALVAELRPVLADTGRAYEIVILDDGSSDGTALIRRAAMAAPSA